MARDRDPNRPAPTTASRDDRLRAALRANLTRRKAQARDRADAAPDEAAPDEGRENGAASSEPALSNDPASGETVSDATPARGAGASGAGLAGTTVAGVPAGRTPPGHPMPPGTTTDHAVGCVPLGGAEQHARGRTADPATESED